MENIKPGWFYIFADGDGIGKMCGRAVIANDVKELHSVSSRIDAAQDFIIHWCKNVGGTKISGGGDEFSASIPPEAKDQLKDLRAAIEKAFGYTISVGVGRTLSEAGTALLVAKLRGKNRIVYFNKHIKEDIKKAKRRVHEGRASQEEYKLSEAYLEKSENMLCQLHKSKFEELHKSHKHGLIKHEEGAHDPKTNANNEDPCPYCADQEDSRTDDCAYCQDLDVKENADGTAGMDGCPACQEYDASKQNTGGIDDCPYCQTDNITEVQANPDQTNLAVEDQAAQRPDDCTECQELYSDAVENQPDQTGQADPKLQGHETAEEIVQALDQEPGADGQTPAEKAKKIDNTELPQGDAMKNGVSVTENFGPAQRKDISDSEKDMNQDDQSDSPNMSEVLQGGLDDHANEQRRQEVVSMVAQTLQGFKANKASLEATKDQNQGLYNSCIQMLKSMIELCKLLGLEPAMPAQAPSDPGAVAEPTQSDAPSVPKQAAPSEGAAQDPKI